MRVRSGGSPIRRLSSERAAIRSRRACRCRSCAWKAASCATCTRSADRSPRPAAASVRSSSDRAMALLRPASSAARSKPVTRTACSRACPAACHSAQARSRRTCAMVARARARSTRRVRSAFRSKPIALAISSSGSGPLTTSATPKLKVGSGSSPAANTCAPVTPSRTRCARRSGLESTVTVAMPFGSSGPARSMVAGVR